MKDFIDRQQLLAEMHMAADGNYHDIFRNIGGEEREYPALTFELAVSMVKDMPAAKPINIKPMDAASMICTLDMLERLALNIHGVIDVVDAKNLDLPRERLREIKEDLK